MRYRKKPVVIEAVKLGWDTWDEMCEHVNVGKLIDGKPEGCYVSPEGIVREGHEATDKMGILIPTLEGVMIGVEGDFIIRGIKGEIYTCKPDIFEATYEKVEGGTE